MEWIIYIGIIIGLIMWIYPIYNVWASRKNGEAELAEAENAEKVAIMKANARLSSAKANKEAEIIEAEAVSMSIKEIGEALEKNPSYNRWQWIKMMDRDNNKSVIYVPTETNIPILEATRIDRPVKVEIKKEN